MEKFDLEQGVDEDILRLHKSGPELLRYPLYNKGTAFTLEERRRLGIEGLLPAEYNTIDQQARRIYKSIFYNHDDVGRNIGLAMLQDRNEVLFYKLLSEHLEDAMPIVYTPTVGKASQYYSRVFRRGRGVFITPDYRGRIEEVLRSAAPFSDVRLMVVTDNEAILGIGDQGAGGMAISVGKLALYCVGAGIHPAQTLPISLDVGTNNQALLDDPLYLGYRKSRLRGAEYTALLDEFVAAARAVFPNVVIQWEDFSKNNALTILDRYRDKVPSFNDDIQGTGAVASASVQAGCRINGSKFTDSRILIYGAGAAGLGIARQLRSQLAAEGLTERALARAILVMDSRGIVAADRSNLDEYKRELAWPATMAAGFGITENQYADLAAVVDRYQPTAIIGASGQVGAFDEGVIRNMVAHTAAPIVLPMSNPTSISEAIPEDVLHWSNGRALVATGSPFDAVTIGDETRRISQANNVFVFPGIGLGAIISGASEITDAMIGASSTALAESLADSDRAEKSLLPSVVRLWDICGNVTLAVARQAVADGVATHTDELEERIAASRWTPRYPAIETVAKT